MLQGIFDDPNRKTNAVARLINLRQTNRLFSDFIASFKKEAAYAGFTDSYALRAILLNTISIELKQYLVTDNDYKSLTFDQLSALSTPLTTTQGGDAIDLSANRVVRGHLTPEEKNRRDANNLYRYCGEPSHFAREYPKKPKRSPLTFRAAGTQEAPTTPTTATISET
ncbi:uncharacterized protein K452DRAFT_296222 [Aplosporella prunicola CBS 121167]|uniref:Retrotransposon gag domain-containing protein n=1 Tax=Aplosporella prunicola CBS 121167 TaxID=1176127 RepID=A0A6A6BN25_9PEZI|nr:uncharacterized protein K452DRAFT_296222 [Aplosporella prunicola CBS 121167]KAF2143951.1 hypothetical protein K452DRAFT_296222 [Aplosporella prunicola CBS 121167]